MLAVVDGAVPEVAAPPCVGLVPGTPAPDSARALTEVYVRWPRPVVDLTCVESLAIPQRSPDKGKGKYEGRLQLQGTNDNKILADTGVGNSKPQTQFKLKGKERNEGISAKNLAVGTCSFANWMRLAPSGRCGEEASRWPATAELCKL